METGAGQEFERDPVDPGQLDDLLRVAFRLQPARSSPAAEEPGADPQTNGDLERNRASYHILGEIARGGMGVILRGRDDDLTRDVAVKVLREDLAKDEGILRRFVEEARIGGRLQHPGIVPVYELGRMADRRPYFAMKLIQGRTLASLLAERSSPAEDRHRFLSIFEQICQAMAYAHSRGILHRDLKPANVMIGSFGEVQILDWGLAKVLGSPEGANARSAPSSENVPVETSQRRSGPGTSHSVAGAVMGTPAYMPPEQARGEVDRVDERSDVFSLGAILCEILTGRAPYAGESKHVRSAAASGAVEDALARLLAVQDAPELAAMCKSCLSPAREDRPRDAQELARSIGKYRASVEDRTRAAEIAAANARVKAKEERKARRLTLALAASIGALFLVAIGVWLWIENGIEARRSQTAKSVNAALDRATQVYGQASSSTDSALWHEALSEIERAQSILESGESSGDLAQRTRDLAARIRAGAEADRKRAERERSNRELLARLSELHVPESQTPGATDWPGVDARYAAAFESDGLDVDAAPVEETAREIRDRGVGVDVAIALDEWAAVRRKLGAAQPVERLVRVATLADPDETRGRLRAALSRNDAGELVGFASSAQLEHLPVATLTLLGNALDKAGASDEALRVLRVAQRLEPGDFVTNVYLGRMVWDHDYREAARHFAAALAVRPQDPVVVHEYGWLLDHYLDESARAVELYRSVLAGRPQDSTLRLYLGHALVNLGDLEGAIAAYTDVLRIEPGRSGARLRLMECYLKEGKADDVLRESREISARHPETMSQFYFVGELLMAQGRAWEAVAEYRKATGMVPAEDGLRRALEAVGDDDGSLESARDVLRSRPDYLLTYFDLGLSLSEMIDVDAAVDQRREALRNHPASPTQHALLGVLLREKGFYTESLFELQTAQGLGEKLDSWLVPSEDPYTEAKRLIWKEQRAPRWAEEAKHLAAIESKLERIASGEASAVDPAEGIEVARLALKRGRPLAAARLFAGTLEANSSHPADVLAGTLVDAASAAASAACGAGSDAAGLTAEERKSWRDRAARWMRADLDRLSTRAGSAGVPDPGETTRELGRWRHDGRLACLRETAAVEALAEPEQAEWRALWTEVESIGRGIREGAQRRAK